MKKIALYLPQFHTIPENDEWWGTGFTEWTNVKKAKPLFKGHYQPEVPINKNYYDLADVSVMEKQSELALKYGIDGFCYYHYWFEGKLLLEKPLENMLKNPKVRIPFMLSWANETWSRTWSGSETEVLISQNYNESYEQWKQHFEYLLSFFKDDRYIKIDNKPVMILYKPHLITNIKELLECWDKLAREHGFNGLFLGFQHHTAFENEFVKQFFDFGIEFEPWYTVHKMEENGHKEKKWHKIYRKICGIPVIYDYDRVWQCILERHRDCKRIMPGVFTAWDNTPRRGKNGYVFHEATPEKFGKYFSELQLNCDSEFVFINAWNEWAEGAYLEPDEKYQYSYLEAVKATLEKR